MKPQTPWLDRRLLAVTILIGGGLAITAPALADGTAAGTNIINRATATYEDPSNPGVSINATSNTVTVTVAEVAGLTVTPQAVTDVNGGTVLPNEPINYDFRITNVGNDPTNFFIPGTATVTGPGTASPLVADLDGDGIYETPIPSGGLTTGLIAPGQSISVQVRVTVNALAPSGGVISVLLGDTGPNNNNAATQNQENAPDGNGTNEVRTVDGTTGTTVVYNSVTYTEAAGAPIGTATNPNGEKEASSTQQILVGSQSQAFATVLKTRTGYLENSALLTDDTITYSLALRVEGTAPVGSVGLAPARLAGTTVNGIGANRVLVSDAIPVGTVLTGTPTTPNAAWTAVYTTEATTIPANQATWTTTNPGAGLTRVGFVYDATTTPINAGTTIAGFSFTVQTSGATGTTTIANIAQVFGTTTGGTTLVYDESGDQSPSNFNDDGTPGSTTPTTGVAAPATEGVDSDNDNTGDGPGGEDNVFTIAAPGTILNGPGGRPDAVGPTNNNDDFSNRSTTVPAGITPGTTTTPATLTAAQMGFVDFANTISNPSGSAVLTSVLLVPDVYNFTAATGERLPLDGTLVTLTYGTQTATYRFNGTNFVFQAGTAIIIPSIPALGSVDYAVRVQLPDGTPVSTDIEQGFSVPLYAFVDTNSDGRPDAGDTTQNRTIDRVYTGFLKLVKEAQILDTNGTTVIQGYTATPNSANIIPGRFIQYRINYTNISIAPLGAGNISLNASNVSIRENGTIDPNNWAKDNDANTVIDTSNVTGTAAGTLNGNPIGTIVYLPSGDQSGPTAATDVTEYQFAPGVFIQPQANGTFIFRRQIN